MRKGNIMDILPILYGLFGIAIVSVLVLATVTLTKEAFVADDTVPQISKDLITEGEGYLPGLFDWFFVLFMVGMPLLAAILAYFNDIVPFLFPLVIALIIVGILVGGSIQVFWEELAEDTFLLSYMERLPMTNFILLNFGKYSLFALAIIAWATFVKLRGGSPSGF